MRLPCWKESPEISGTKEKQRELGPTATGGGCLGGGHVLRLGRDSSETEEGYHCKCPTWISGAFFISFSRRANQRQDGLLQVEGPDSSLLEMPEAACDSQGWGPIQVALLLASVCSALCICVSDRPHSEDHRAQHIAA